MPEIPLTQDQVTIVDDIDYDFLMQFKWYANKIGHGYYAVRNIRQNGRGTSELMHRAIAERMDILADQIDHRDQDQLNNRRENLRPATMSENQHNQGFRQNNTSGYLGVHWDSSKSKWQARVQHQGKRRHLGYFEDPAEASEVYKAKKRELAGEFSPKEITPD